MNKIILLLLSFLSFSSVFGQVPTVSISDHNGNIDNALIDCSYNFIPPQKIQLTASFPSLETTTDYTSSTTAYNLIGNLSEGNPVSINADDVWSSTIPIGFTFCFYGNSYTNFNVSDNGIVRFGYNPLTPEGSFSSITNTTPSPSLVRNAIFGSFHDYIVAPVGFGCTTNCGTISYSTIGTAPFRKTIINFNGLNYFNCLGADARKAYFQIVISETTNEIDVNVQDKPLACLGNISANGNGNSLIGLNNSNGTLGVAAPSRNTSAFAITNESYKFTPSGASATSIVWTNQFGVSLGSNNPIEIIPPQANTFYTATVTYNTCIPRQIQGVYNITYDPSFPTSLDIIENICDDVAPFPSQIYDVEALVTPIVGETISFHNSQLEADNNINPILNMNTYNLTSATTVFYYRRTLGTCYSTARITVNLYQTPDLNDVTINYCDAGNDNVENNIYLPYLNNQIAGFNSGWMTASYFQNLANATANINPISYINLTNPPGFYDVFVRVYNASRPQCFDIITMTVQLLPTLVLDVPTVACIPDTGFDFNENFDLTSIPITASTGPINPADLTLSYYTTLSNANNQSNPISNPNSFNLNIPQPQPSTTIYVVANATGYCSGIVPVVLTFCVADGGDDGSGGNGNGGFGGLGACLEVGDAIPTFDLNVVYSNVMTAIPVIPVPVSVGFYTTLLGAQTQDVLVQLTPAEVSAFTPVAPFSEIWVRFIDANGIVGIKRIIVPLKFKKHEVRDFEICDVFNDNTEFIDLENSPTPISYIQQIELENPNETVTAYESMADYLSNNNPITSFTLIGPTTTVYVKVSSYGCDSDYTLNFNLKSFDILTPIITKVCDIDSDGTEVFDLTTLLPTTNTTGYTTPNLTLHNTLNDAYTNINPIANPTTFTVNATTTVFIRIEETAVLPPNTPIVCPSIQEVQFGFYDSVNVNTIGIQTYCDLDNDNQVVLGNLNALVTSIVIVDPLQPIDQHLYTTLLSAQNSDPTFEILPDWDLFTYDTTILGTTGTIYLQLTNTITNCTRIVPIQIQINSLPLTVNSTVSYCDFENDNNEAIANFQVFNSQIITTNSVLYTFQYFETIADATAGTPELPIGFAVQDGTIIYVSIQSGLTSGCSSITPITINFNPSPTVINITPIVCDNLGNGSEIVNLFSYQSQLVASTVGLTFQYYTSLSNLQNNINALSAYYTTNHNAVFDALNNAPIVYVKVIDNATQCFSVATISITRNIIIDAYDTTQFSCDISVTNQLEAVFNLEASIPRIGTEGMIVNPTDYTISFHLSNANAVNNVLPIANTTNFSVVANQSTNIFVRFQDNVTGCFTIKILELQIYNLPKFVNSVYSICDYNLDGIYVFNLNELNGTVVEDPTPFTFEYYNSEADGLAGINPITNFSNYVISFTDFPKTIYVKGTNINNCSKVKGVIVSLKPNVTMLASNVDLIECDADNNGLEVFNLTDANPLLTSETGITFTYFTTLVDMQNSANAISNPTTYQNVAPNIIYVRLTKDTDYCDVYGTINLIPFYEDYVFPTITNFCDNNANGTEIIDLEQTVYSILSTYSSTEISLQFFTSNADAIAGTNAIASLYTFTNFTTPIFVKITNIATNCPIIKQLNYSFYSPVVLTNYDTKICDFDRNNSELVDLSSYFNQLNANFSTYTITSYLTQNGAENEVASELISNTNYTQTLTNQTYWIRFVDVAGCYSVTSIAIEIVPYPNPLTNPTKIELCDVNGNNDLTEIFDITLNENYIRNGNSSWAITYHNSQTDAQTGNNPIINSTTFSSLTTSVWIRVVTTPISSLTTCAVVIEQELEVIPLPTPNLNPITLVKCDDNLTGDLQEVFNISENETYVRNGDASAIVSYHTSQSDAQNGLLPITNITNYLSASTSIWIRVQSNVPTTLTNCAIVVEQELEVVPKPFNLVLTLPKLVKCDDILSGNLTESFDLSANESLLLNGNTSYQVSYHTTLPDAEIGTNPILNFATYESGNTTVFVRIIVVPANALTSCAVVTSQEIEVTPLPNPNLNPIKLVKCDDNLTGDLQEIFNISENETYVRNGDASAIVSYHTSQSDAQNGLLPITNITNYLSASTSIWIRVQSNVPTTLTNCAIVVEQELEVVPKPYNLVLTLPKLVKCDDVLSGNLTESFDLSTNQTLLLNGNTSYQVSYHTTLPDAEIGTNPILNFTNYESGNTTVYVRIIVIPANALTSCAVVTMQEIEVTPLPTPNLNPIKLVKCDDNLTGDLQEVFNISENETYVRNGDASAIVSYHTTQSDAQNGLLPITNITNYLSVSTSVWIRVQSNVPTSLTNCAIVVEQELEVVPKPYNLVLTLPKLVKCDDILSGNLTESFDLSTNQNLLLNGNTSYQVSYHTTLTDAEIGTNPILNFTNYESGNTTVFVRIIVVPANALTSCAVVTSQELKVNPLPQITTVTPLYSCIINNSGQASFNLTSKKTEILNGQNPSIFLVSFHLTEQDAKQRINGIVSPYLSTSTTIWASIMNNTTNCVATVSFSLVAENTAFAITPNNITICDEDGTNDGFNTFDFNPLIPIILGSQNGNPDISIAFYESNASLIANQPIVDISNYINLTSTQVIYVKVVDESTQNKCNTITNFTIKVNLLPEPTPQDGFICTDPTTNQLLSTFIIDSGLSATNHTFDWYLNTTLLPNENGNTLEVSQGGNYFVVATNNQTNCESEPKLSTIIESQPALASVRVEYSFQDNIKIVVSAIGSGDYVYQLNNGNIQNSNTFENVEAGTHIITIYDNNGCNSVTLEVVVLDYDRFFTPNGDGFNEHWHIRGIKGQPDAKVYIFDRYGKFIKELIPGKEGWDGKLNGIDLFSTDYWFTVYYKENGENKEFRAHFTLKR